MDAPATTTAAPAATEDSTTTLYRAALGPLGTKRYLPLFTRFDGSERVALHWNWSAALLTFNWLVFRKLWHAALGYSGAVVALTLLVFGIGRLVFQFSETVDAALGALVLALLVLLPGLYGDALLHADCRRRMTLALRNTDTEAQACAALARQASTRARLITIAVINGLAMALLVAVYLQWSELGNLAVDIPHAATPAKAAPTPVVPLPVPAASAPGAAASAASAPASTTSAAIAPATPAAPASAPIAALAPASAAHSSAPAIPCPDCLRPLVGSSGRSAQGPAHIDPIPSKSEPPAQAMPAQVAASQARAPASQPLAQGRAGAPATVASAPQASAPAASAPRPARPASRPKTTTAPKGTLVNVGLFAVDSNAAAAYARLQEAGLPATSEKFPTSKGPRTRVRAGPFESREAAQAAVEKIQALGLDALIVPQ